MLKWKEVKCEKTRKRDKGGGQKETGERERGRKSGQTERWREEGGRGGDWRRNLHKSRLSSPFWRENRVLLPFPHHILEVTSICGVFDFMIQDSISQRSPPLGEY